MDIAGNSLNIALCALGVLCAIGIGVAVWVS
jgi:hypothetical protein